jgi:hypothetical protein
MKLGDALRPLLEFRFRVRAISMFGDRLIVFGAEFGPELLRPGFPNVHPENNPNHQEKADKEAQYNRIRRIHSAYLQLKSIGKPPGAPLDHLQV